RVLRPPEFAAVRTVEASAGSVCAERHVGSASISATRAAEVMLSMDTGEGAGAVLKPTTSTRPANWLVGPWRLAVPFSGPVWGVSEGSARGGRFGSAVPP